MHVIFVHFVTLIGSDPQPTNPENGGENISQVTLWT